jgi:PEP-CTERM motif
MKRQQIRPVGCVLAVGVRIFRRSDLSLSTGSSHARLEDFGMKSLLLAATAALALAAALPAAADVLYDNGPSTYKIDAIPISGANVVANSFTAAAGATATGLEFVTWGAQTTSVDWQISNGDPEKAGATVLASGTSSVTADFLGVFALATYSNTIDIGSVALSGGDYWLQLSGATPSQAGQSIYWDTNNGPSAGDWLGQGDTGPFGECGAARSCTGSESFQVLGTVPSALPGTGGGVPEPASWALMISGFGLAGAAMRRRRSLARAA